MIPAYVLACDAGGSVNALAEEERMKFLNWGERRRRIAFVSLLAILRLLETLQPPAQRMPAKHLTRQKSTTPSIGGGCCTTTSFPHTTIDELKLIGRICESGLATFGKQCESGD
jgi:hypothetical protein